MTHLPKVAEWVRFKRKSGSNLLDNQQFLASDVQLMQNYAYYISVFNNLKKFSIAELSRQFPFLDIL